MMSQTSEERKNAGKDLKTSLRFYDVTFERNVLFSFSLSYAFAAMLMSI